MKQTVKLRFPADAVIEQDDEAVWIDTGMMPEELIKAVAISAVRGPEKAVAYKYREGE